MAGELPAQEPDEKPGPEAGLGLMGWKDVDELCASEGALRAAALSPHGGVAPRPEKKCLTALPVRVFQQARGGRFGRRF
jgi:hypothetical protein